VHLHIQTIGNPETAGFQQTPAAWLQAEEPLGHPRARQEARPGDMQAAILKGVKEV